MPKKPAPIASKSRPAMGTPRGAGPDPPAVVGGGHGDRVRELDEAREREAVRTSSANAPCEVSRRIDVAFVITMPLPSPPGARGGHAQACTGDRRDRCLARGHFETLDPEPCDAFELIQVDDLAALVTTFLEPLVRLEQYSKLGHDAATLLVKIAVHLAALRGAKTGAAS